MDLLVYTDDYLNTDLTDTGRTTAFVLTSPPGYVTLLPKSWKIVAPHPTKYEYYIAFPNSVKFYAFDGTSMINIPTKDINLQNVTSAAFNKTGEYLFVSQGTKVYLYGFDGTNPVMLSSVDTGSPVTAVARGDGELDFWAISGGKVQEYKWTGSNYLKVNELAGVTAAVSLDTSDGINAVAVVENGKIKYFLFDGTNYTLISNLSADVPNALSVLVRENGDYMAYDGLKTMYYSVSEGSATLIDALSENIGGLSIVKSNWHEFEYVVLQNDKVSYRAIQQNGYIENPGLSISNIRSLLGSTQIEGVYMSKPVATRVPMTKVVVNAVQEVPPFTAVEYFVSADGGLNWQQVVPGEVTQLSVPGSSMVYSIVLYGSSTAIPKIDKVEILQIGDNSIKISDLPPGTVKVRLIE